MNTNFPGFYITRSKGFHIVFANGWTVSVQFGPGNYCDNYDLQIGSDEKEAGENGSGTAEVAAWPDSGDMVRFGDDGDTVAGRKTPTDVLALLNWASEQPRTPVQTPICTVFKS